MLVTQQRLLTGYVVLLAGTATALFAILLMLGHTLEDPLVVGGLAIATAVSEVARNIVAHVGLGEMYVADPRFTKTYEDMAEGLGVQPVAREDRHVVAVDLVVGGAAAA